MTTFGAVARRGGWWLPVVGAAALASSFATLALPSVLGRAVDALVAGSGSRQWLLWAAGLIALGIAADLVDSFAGVACIAGTTAWLRERMVRHVLGAEPAATARFDTGDLVSRVSGNAVDAARAGLVAVTVGTALLPPVGSLVLLILIDVWVAAAFLAGVLLVALVLRAFTKHTTEAIAAYQRCQGELAGRLGEALTGARTIAAAGTVEQEQRRVLQPLDQLRRHGLRSWQVLSRTVAQAAVVGPLVLVAVLAVGGLALAGGRISPGELFAATQYAALGAGLGGLTGVFSSLARARAGIGRTADVLNLPALRYGNRPLPPAEDGPAGELRLVDVTVRTGDTVLLDRVNLVLPAGATVAVVGRSGAGKSVLAALAARLRDPDEGQVLLDAVPMPQLSQRELRAAVGCAFERPVLVGGTVADAVGLGRDRQTVLNAARATHAHEFVSRLPQGYDTALAAAPMSGGERQRLGLARAWPATRLVVLDDATSSLDTVTEMQISRTLTEDGRRTRLIVTHRAATAARADLVVWLDSGQVRGSATHEALWQDPTYRAVFG